MRAIYFFGVVLIFSKGFCQNFSLVLNGAYVVFSSTSSVANKAYMVVNQPNVNGIKRNSGHIISENQYNYIKWNTGATTGNYVFPFGVTTNSYIPLSVDKVNAVASNVSASTWHTPNTNVPYSGVTSVAACSTMGSVYGGSPINSVIDRWWDVVSSTTFSANVTYRYTGQENTTLVPLGMFQAQSWDGVAWRYPWAGAYVGAVTGIGFVITTTAISNFEPTVLVNSLSPLPIELVYFDAACENEQYYFNWETATEHNNEKFEVEFSDDALSWKKLCTVMGAGNSTTTKNYSWVQSIVSSSTNVYFRLKQTDFDGTYSYSQIVTVENCAKNGNDAFGIYPNPVSNSLLIDLKGLDIKGISYELYDALGQIVVSENLSENRIDFIGISTGIYFLRLQQNHVDLMKPVKIIKE